MVIYDGKNICYRIKQMWFIRKSKFQIDMCQVDGQYFKINPTWKFVFLFIRVTIWFNLFPFISQLFTFTLKDLVFSWKPHTNLNIFLLLSSFISNLISSLRDKPHIKLLMVAALDSSWCNKMIRKTAPTLSARGQIMLF